MERILITGASGFIGSHLVEKALELGMETFAGVRKTSNRKYLTHPPKKIVELDFNRPDSIRKLLKEYAFDYVIHNAGTTHAPVLNTYLQVNCGNLQTLVEILQEEQIPVQKLVYMSSLAAFGPNEYHNHQQITEQSQPHPVTFYGKSKLQAEEYLKSQTIPYVIIRPSAVYGPRDVEFNTVYKSIEAGIEIYVTRKKQKLSFIYVEDLTDAIFKSLNGPDRSCYFVSDGKTYTLQEFYRTIKTILNKKTIPIYFPVQLVRLAALFNELTGKILHHYPFFNRDKVKELSASGWDCDIKSLTDQTGFTPNYNLQQGLQKTLTDYRSINKKNHKKPVNQ